MLTKLFGYNPKETTVRTEVMAGLTTFLTMAYILAVNPNILSETGMDKGALFTTTVIMAGISTIFMGLYAKKHCFSLKKLQLWLAVYGGSILIFVLNTFVLYVDSKVYGYYSFVYIFGTVFLRSLICIAKAAVFSAVMPMLLETAKRVMK